MAIPSVFHELVETWISEHPGKGCTKKTGKRELVTKFQSRQMFFGVFELPIQRSI
jgi:hypothetical protein